MVRRQDILKLTIKADTYSNADRMFNKIKSFLSKNNIKVENTHKVPISGA
jgi:hypothetical protein